MLLTATYFFAFQIYADFAGYSTIAIGAAKVLGFDLMKNFRQPYLATSIPDFWSRWHISLSTWFRDYLYIPLGGNRVEKWRWYLNIFIVFLVSGLWHGANWTFVIWGALHGFYSLCSHFFRAPRQAFVHLIGLDRWPRVLNMIQVLIVFHLVLIGWVFFRAASVSDALAVLSTIGTWLAGLLGNFNWVAILPRLGGIITWFDLAVVVAAVTIVLAHNIFVEFREGRPVPANGVTYYGSLVFYDLLFLGILGFGLYTEKQFIYFQF